MAAPESLPEVELWSDPPKMDVGSPRPELYFSDDLYCTYYLSDLVSPDQELVGVLRFERVLHFRMGHPNDEVLHGHPLYKYGLKPYGFFSVLNSSLITEIEASNAVHDRHRSGMYFRFKHWIITFHDQTLEVVSRCAAFLGTSELAPLDAIRAYLERDR